MPQLLVPHLLKDPDALFHALLNEVQWETMNHRGGPIPRRIAVQAAPGDVPLYRHLADALPPVSTFTPTVLAILEAAQAHLEHPLNHVLIQHYRSGADHISPHSDKTLDVLRGSSIVNVSLGAQRTMTLRPKKEFVAHEEDDEVQIIRVPLTHTSMFILDPETNVRYLHGIKHDNRPLQQKSAPELAFNAERISLTFRSIATFLIPAPIDNRHLIYGQGAISKDRASAQLVPLPPSALEDGSAEKELVESQVSSVIGAFGEENFRADSFDWDAWYGQGFNVVHFA